MARSCTERSISSRGPRSRSMSLRPHPCPPARRAPDASTAPNAAQGPRRGPVPPSGGLGDLALCCPNGTGTGCRGERTEGTPAGVEGGARRGVPQPGPAPDQPGPRRLGHGRLGLRRRCVRVRVPPRRSHRGGRLRRGALPLDVGHRPLHGDARRPPRPPPGDGGRRPAPLRPRGDRGPGHRRRRPRHGRVRPRRGDGHRRHRLPARADGAPAPAGHPPGRADGGQRGVEHDRVGRLLRRPRRRRRAPRRRGRSRRLRVQRPHVPLVRRTRGPDPDAGGRGRPKARAPRRQRPTRTRPRGASCQALGTGSARSSPAATSPS